MISLNRNKILKEFSKHSYKLDYVHSVEGYNIDIPMIYKDANVAMFFFPVSISKALKYIDNTKFQLVSFYPGKTLLAINVFEYRDNPAGSFGEFTFSFPVVNKTKKVLPLIPIIFDQMYKDFGFYVIQLGASTDMGRKHIEDIWGYPTYDNNLNILLSDKENTIKASIYEGDELIFSASEYLSENRKPKFQRKNYNTFFKKNDDLRRVQLETFLMTETFLGKRNFEYKLGNHSLSQMLQDIGIEDKFATVYYSDSIEIAGRVKSI